MQGHRMSLLLFPVCILVWPTAGTGLNQSDAENKGLIPLNPVDINSGMNNLALSL